MYHPLEVYNSIAFSAFNRLVNLRYLRLKVVRKVAENGERKTHLEDICFIVVRGNDNFETLDVYEMRCTESVITALYRCLNSFLINEYRPDGKEWKERWGDTFTGSPDHRYYSISDVWSVFSKVNVCKYMYKDDKSTILALFFNEDIKEQENKGRKQDVIWIPMTEAELLRQHMDKDPIDDFYYEIDDYDKEREIYDEDENSWMDNDDDYWNVD